MLATTSVSSVFFDVLQMMVEVGAFSCRLAGMWRWSMSAGLFRLGGGEVNSAYSAHSA